jgi:hypothetical protein
MMRDHGEADNGDEAFAASKNGDLCDVLATDRLALGTPRATNRCIRKPKAPAYSDGLTALLAMRP